MYFGIIPIINNKPNYNKWFEENKDDLLEIYYMITNYDKDMDFLNECNFDLAIKKVFKKYPILVFEKMVKKSI